MLKYLKMGYAFNLALSCLRQLFCLPLYFILFIDLQYFSSSFIVHVPVVISMESRENQSAFTITPRQTC